MATGRRGRGRAFEEVLRRGRETNHVRALYLITALNGGFGTLVFSRFTRTFWLPVRLVSMQGKRIRGSRNVRRGRDSKGKKVRRKKGGPKQGLFGWGLRGGPREGSGRPRIEGSESHQKRAEISRHHPLHVTSHLVRGRNTLRKRAELSVIRGALAAQVKREGFRLIEYSIQSNHIHLLVEADSKKLLASGLGGIFTSIAKRLNKHWGRTGKVFRERYFARALRTPREVKNVLNYLFFNWRKHKTYLGVREFLDLCTSAIHFQGWGCELPKLPDWVPRTRETDEAQTWLLRVGWSKHHGLLAPA